MCQPDSVLVSWSLDVSKELFLFLTYAREEIWLHCNHCLQEYVTSSSFQRSRELSMTPSCPDSSLVLQSPLTLASPSFPYPSRPALLFPPHHIMSDLLDPLPHLGRLLLHRCLPSGQHCGSCSQKTMGYFVTKWCLLVCIEQLLPTDQAA